MTIPPGSTIGGYRLGELLGEGGMGAVYRATDEDGAQVVVKLIRPEFAGRTHAAARFAREASITSSLSHPAIVRVLSSDIEGPQPFIALEYIEGRTLDEVIEDEAPLGVPRSVEIILQLLAVLAHAHEKGIAHRDLKPANVMITVGPDGTEGVKVLDFGIACLFDEARHTRLTQTGQLLGTPGFLSPEQAAGERVDGRADLWALGVMLYVMLSNERPFPGDTAAAQILALFTHPPAPITTFRPDLPEPLVAVLERMLTKDPAERYLTAPEVSEAIARTGSARALAPRALWGRPFALPLLFAASLLIGGLVMGVAFSYLTHDDGLAGAVTSTNEVDAPLMAVAPVDLPGAPATEADHPANADAGRSPDVADSGTRTPTAMTMRTKAAPAGRTASPCANGVVWKTNEIARGGRRNSAGRITRALRPAFFASAGCLDNVHPGDVILDVTIDDTNFVSRVRFQQPGPLGPRSQRCLRRGMEGNTDTDLAGPDRLSLIVHLACHERPPPTAP
ncbi:MAG: hypothetical protein DRJ42_10675 [Deltaproteobacteria bacterium]|nr:MAG: hypothetical protein DRJ42_10675 [Deltaproteobacteria bacterium]